MRSDKQITDIVIQTLLWDARVSPARINVKTKNGEVTLSGTVDTFYKKWSAIDAVLKIPHVLEVKDNLIVKTTDKVEDQFIEKNIKEALQNDSRLQQTKINCDVQKGRVLLSGEVVTYYQKIAAEETCRWIKGVTKVENEIEVSMPGKKYDKIIKEKIENLIDDSKLFEDASINIDVDNSIVLLSGSVNSIYQKMHAEVLASLVSNVVFVKNNIKIKSQTDSD